MAAPDGYLCDTIPEPKNLALHAAPAPALKQPIRPHTSILDSVEHAPKRDVVPTPATLTTTAPRKLCVRHQRMADEGTSLKMQQSLDALPLKDREAVNMIWSNFSSSSHPRRALILQGLLTMCCFSQLSLLTDQLQHLIRLDPFKVFPREVSLKVLQYIDAISLGRAAQVSKHWRSLADDDILWRNICEQHIDKKCSKCGWGLPLLEKRRVPVCSSLSPPPASFSTISSKRERDPEMPGATLDPRPLKRAKSDHGSATLVDFVSSASGLSDYGDLTPRTLSPPPAVTRPWKDVYCERLIIERNWRSGRCSVRTLEGHTDGVMCMQFSEHLSHPSFPILITGSYDRTARVWNLETGREVRCLTGHTRAVRALQFDEAKLITGSMDRTLRVWDWRTGRCIRTLEGHTEGVVSLNFDKDVLASGSVDTTVKVWNFRNGECFTLRGHRDWVNAVALWDGPDAMTPADDTPAPTDGCVPGKMLFSASDDGEIRLWDLARRACIRQFSGHVGQVQSICLVTLDPDADGNELLAPSAEARDEEERAPRPPLGDPRSTLPSGLPGWAPASVSIPTLLPANHPGFGDPAFEAPPGFDPYAYRSDPSTAPTPRAFPHSDSDGKGKQRSRSTSPARKRGPIPVLVSGSLDNTIKVWDIESGKAVKTLFGHIEGVWSIACDKLRMVSGSHDRTIKVWVREEGRCMTTLVGHRGAVTCVALGDDKIVSGSDDGDIKIWTFSPS